MFIDINVCECSLHLIQVYYTYVTDCIENILKVILVYGTLMLTQKTRERVYDR